jgi:Uri superfamily endonuclease
MIATMNLFSELQFIVPKAVAQLPCEIRGVYILGLRLSRPTTVRIGASGRRQFPLGFYLYVGSAQNGLRQRLLRHMRRNKPQHWHIDFLRHVTAVYGIWMKTTTDVTAECQLADRLAQLPGAAPMPGFGCSDCRCRTHLFHLATLHPALLPPSTA